MSVISDKIQAANDSADAAIARVQVDVQTFRDEIARLQALVDAGTATQADLDALDALKAKTDALDPISDSTLSDVPK